MQTFFNLQCTNRGLIRINCQSYSMLKAATLTPTKSSELFSSGELSFSPVGFHKSGKWRFCFRGAESHSANMCLPKYPAEVRCCQVLSWNQISVSIKINVSMLFMCADVHLESWRWKTMTLATYYTDFRWCFHCAQVVQALHTIWAPWQKTVYYICI